MTTTLPAGWKLVPIEPTEEMLVALGGMGWMVQQKPESYAAMLAAAPEAPSITVSLDPDPRGVSVGVWHGSHCIYNGAHAVPATVAPGDAQDERQAFEAWAKRKKMPLARIGQQYDDFWVDHAWNGWQARAALAAPVAGDAREVDPLQGAANWLVQAHSQPCPTVLSACLMIGYNRAQRLYDAAIAAQQGKGGEK